jgi:hypothetical protein
MPVSQGKYHANLELFMDSALYKPNSSGKILKASIFISSLSSLWILVLYTDILPSTSSVLIISLLAYLAVVTITTPILIGLAFSNSIGNKAAFGFLACSFFVALVVFQIFSRPMNDIGLKVFRLEYTSLAQKALKGELNFISEKTPLIEKYWGDDSYVQLPINKGSLWIPRG